MFPRVLRDSVTQAPGHCRTGGRGRTEGPFRHSHKTSAQPGLGAGKAAVCSRDPSPHHPSISRTNQGAHVLSAPDLPWPCRVSVITPILLMGKLRPTEVTMLAQGHTVVT